MQINCGNSNFYLHSNYSILFLCVKPLFVLIIFVARIFGFPINVKLQEIEA